MDRVLEICVDDLPGLEMAIAGGGYRIELCSPLSVGGLTPSPALAAIAVATALPVHAMIRLRVGDFTYQPGEIDLVAEDIARLAEIGVLGFVVGAAHANGTLDPAALSALPGFDYVYSSGGCATAPAGAATLAQMVLLAASRLTVIGGGGIDASNVARLMQATGIRQVHGSASVEAMWSDRRIQQMGFCSRSTTAYITSKVAALKRAILKA